jgi:dihydroflavonol-4-reductase
MTDPRARGQRFPMGSGTFSLMEMASILRPAIPERAARLPRFEVPDWIVRLLGVVDADVRGNLGELGTRKTADASAVRALLGRDLIAPEEAMIAAARSLIAQGIA